MPESISTELEEQPENLKLLQLSCSLPRRSSGFLPHQHFGLLGEQRLQGCCARPWEQQLLAVEQGTPPCSVDKMAGTGSSLKEREKSLATRFSLILVFALFCFVPWNNVHWLTTAFCFMEAAR